MMELASAVVQVVTSVVDWPAVVAAISGGVVGLAGIVVAARQFRRGISAEDERAKLAEKRRVCARFHTSLDNVFAIAAPSTPRPTADMLSDLDAALPAMYNAASELRLIASPEVGKHAAATAGGHAGHDHDSAGRQPGANWKADLWWVPILQPRQGAGRWLLIGSSSSPGGGWLIVCFDRSACFVDALQLIPVDVGCGME